MANRPDPNKRRFTYLEYKEVFAAIEDIAKKEGKSPTEVIRETVLNRVNHERVKSGKAPLNLDPSSEGYLKKEQSREGM